MPEQTFPKKGARDLARELSFISIYIYDLAKESLTELLNMDWYEKMELFSNEDGELFVIQPNIKEDTLSFYKQILNGTVSNLEQIDRVIKDHLVKWSFDRLHASDKAILRISIYSLLYQLDIPIEVIISEANELSEKYCDENTPHYINGILHKVKEKYRKNAFDSSLQAAAAVPIPETRKKLSIKKKTGK
jgi:transcription antitermination protein NusB